MKIKELCFDERPREKMLDKGAESLSNAELLAILLRTGTNKMNVIDVARELLRCGGGKINGVSAMPLERLCSISGIGPGKAVTVAAAFELGRRCAIEPLLDSRKTISSPKTVFQMLIPHFRNISHEECWILFLTRANYLIAKERLSTGGSYSTIMDTSTIVRKALEKKAAKLIMAHNHPSGNAMPSTEDVSATRQLTNALKTCDMHLLDHVIISGDSYYSFADEEIVSL